MKFNPSTFVKLLLIGCLSVVCVAEDFDFFYFVQQVSETFYLMLRRMKSNP